MMRKKTKHFPFLALQHERFVLHVDNQTDKIEVPSEKWCYQWIWHALKNTYRRAEISLLFLDEETARAYNRDYRSKDYATNILSFALNEGENVLLASDATDVLMGDLVICPQVVIQEAKEQHKPLMNHYAHLLVHGTLHLMGFDHINDADAEKMEQLEIELLAAYNIANPYE